MGDLSGSDAKSMGKCHVVIAWSVNKTFGPWKINAPPVRWDGAHGPSELAGVRGPLAVGGRGVTSGI